jgi:alpha-D-ribose 1-methylphosphonate 5-triphosphate synthase subunit PhnI
MAFGQHERKAIAMGIIDLSMSIPGNTGPAADEEFVLQHCDALESSGFVEHLKMPHYVTFQSALDRVRFRRLAQLARQKTAGGVG